MVIKSGDILSRVADTTERFVVAATCEGGKVALVRIGHTRTPARAGDVQIGEAVAYCGTYILADRADFERIGFTSGPHLVAVKLAVQRGIETRAMWQDAERAPLHEAWQIPARAGLF